MHVSLKAGNLDLYRSTSNSQILNLYYNMTLQGNASPAQLLAEVDKIDEDPNCKDKDKIDDGKASFVFEEIKERLKSILESSDTIDKKIHNFILLKVAIIGLFTGALFKPIPNSASIMPEMNELNISIIVFIGILTVGLIQLVLALSPKKYFVTGSSPQEIYKKSILEKNLKAIKISLGASYQERIDLAEENQRYKVKKLKFSLYVLIIDFVFLALSPLLFFLKSRFF